MSELLHIWRQDTQSAVHNKEVLQPFPFVLWLIILHKTKCKRKPNIQKRVFFWQYISNRKKHPSNCTTLGKFESIIEAMKTNHYSTFFYISLLPFERYLTCLSRRNVKQKNNVIISLCLVSKIFISSVNL